MRCSLFQGLGTALVTPFSENGDIDWRAFGELLERQVDALVNFVVPLGTTGESPSMRDIEEYELVLHFVISRIAGRISVLAGTGSNDTYHTVKMTEKAQGMGANGVLVVAPYYNKPPPRGVVAHYHAVADVGLPVVVYNIPGRCIINVEPETLAEIAEHENVVGLKDATGKVDEQALENMRLSGDKLAYLSGDDALALAYIRNGGHGLISVVSNLVPKEMKALVDAARAGDWVRAEKLNEELSPLFKAIFTKGETNPIGIKYAMSALGMINPVWQLPMVEPLLKTKNDIYNAMHGFRLL